MKSLIIVFGVILLLIAIPYVFQATEDAQTETLTQSYAEVNTPAAVTSANVTLGTALFESSTTSVSSVTSNISGDAPTAASYNATGPRALNISGLSSGANRTITVSYAITSTQLPAGASLFLGLFRWFYVFIIIGMAGGAIYAFFD